MDPAPESGVPVTVSVVSDVGKSLLVATVIVVLEFVPVTGFGEIDVVIRGRGGVLATLSDTFPFDPFARWTSIGTSTESPAIIPTAGSVVPSVKSGGGGVAGLVIARSSIAIGLPASFVAGALTSK